MRIFVKDSKGEDLQFEISENDKIEALKKKVTERLKNKNESQLVFDGALLEDNQTISYYDIQPNNYIICLGTFIAGIVYIKLNI